MLLAAIIERHSLILGNASEKCMGTITRSRVTRQRCEQSVIDIVIFSNDLKEHMVSMHIDEDRKHVLKKIRKLKKGVKLTTCDHNTILTELNL